MYELRTYICIIFRKVYIFYTGALYLTRNDVMHRPIPQLFRKPRTHNHEIVSFQTLSSFLIPSSAACVTAATNGGCEANARVIIGNYLLMRAVITIQQAGSYYTSADVDSWLPES